MKQKNVVILMADQLRYDMLGKGFTPHIDSLAADGVQFTRAYCACPLCVPSRGAIFTGTYPNVNGSLINPWFVGDRIYGDVQPGVETLYELMERSGWECVHSGKQHVYTAGTRLEKRPGSRTKWFCTEEDYKEMLRESGVPAPGGPAYRAIVPEMCGGTHTRACKYSNAATGCYEPGQKYYFDGYCAGKAVEGIRARKPDEPLFLSVMFRAPHPPLNIPDPYYSQPPLADSELPENVGRWYPYQSPLQLYNLTGAIGTRYTREQWRESWRVYKGLVRLLDDCVGRILDELKAQGLYEDSLIVFTTDHGEMLGSHRLFQKMCMYEESVRTPVTIKFPGGWHAGLTESRPVSQIDLMPTLCDYLGIAPRSAMNGVSLLPVLDGGAPQRPVHIQFDGNGARSNFQRCIVDGELKLIADIFKDEVYYELYDVCADPQEKNNLLFCGDIPQRAQDMLECLRAHMRATGDMLEPPAANLAEFVSSYRALSGLTVL